MDPTPILSLMVSLLSLIVSVLSGVVAVLAVRTSKRIAMEATTLQLHNFADQICHANPELYELHGIAADDLTRAGVTVPELTYVVHSFDAGEAYYRIQEPTQVVLTEYRRQMLRHPKVQLIWKSFVVGKTFSRSRFTEAVDRFIVELGSQSPTPNQEVQQTPAATSGSGSS